MGINRFLSALFVTLGVAALLGACGCNSSSAGAKLALMDSSGAPSGGLYNVRSFGAAGDGKTIDTPAINKAIDAAADAGGGTVFFPAGTYACYSIHLKSNIALYLDQGATIQAADPPEQQQGGGYDAPEPNQWGDVYRYQDFGHTHWHNSLIWGENLENISILGPGMIDGKGLSRGGLPRGWTRFPDGSGAPEAGAAARGREEYSPTTAPGTASRFPAHKDLPHDYLPAGIGNKAIALKLCRNVVMKDFTIYRGGHFGILATGVDNWTMDNIKIDTNRDGVDIDCCQNVRMSNCTVNSPSDDGICPKSSFALGHARPTENLTITNCQVSGYECGSFLDGTYKKLRGRNGGEGNPTGRIKFGTESNGGFKNITISNCVFSYCRGFALESVDGALLEDVTINNITMRDIVNCPIFMRLGARLRGPDDSKVGQLRRIMISNVVCYNADPRYGCIISGIPGHDIEDVRLSNIRIYYKGGGTEKWASTQPAEKESTYPEPSMFGPMPAYGFYLRHVSGILMDNVEVSTMENDVRPPFALDDVKNATFRFINAPHEQGTPMFSVKDVDGFTTFQVNGLEDMKKGKLEREKF